ncbi:hypothetical protein TraAM80_05472 [Trypanosoma rangeli]|uniref:Uncharacterized protein n=1 Tax=Trypanosoma rangeli TaxID=5698 RepID=A0A3R7MK79_TRYRA|nr:uncharacterized protein TraAM80_05472 [Trypanosoma rangeli]RNF04022.1 hypothetical protein TraAM80_05472 [Trypanosoma rangeli]|eukprot:RNF04022.1 hypothetical protein TraAM80_05472 [Trypanosoma rangeli]
MKGTCSDAAVGFGSTRKCTEIAARPFRLDTLAFSALLALMRESSNKVRSQVKLFKACRLCGYCHCTSRPSFSSVWGRASTAVLFYDSALNEGRDGWAGGGGSAPLHL